MIVILVILFISLVLNLVIIWAGRELYKDYRQQKEQLIDIRYEVLDYKIEKENAEMKLEKIKKLLQVNDYNSYKNSVNKIKTILNDDQIRLI